MSKVRWGILSTAKIAVTKVIPGMQKGVWSEVTAIASRDRRKAEDAARTLGIARSYGSYEELLADPQIEAIYNPCRTSFTSRGQSKLQKPASTSCARSR
jgi:predicted dehydrogenase